MFDSYSLLIPVIISVPFHSNLWRKTLETWSVLVHLSVCLSAVLITKHPTFFHFKLLEGLFSKITRPIVCSTSIISVYQPADPLKETDTPGIFLRLSSLTITKALIRLDSSSPVGSEGSLVLSLCLLISSVFMVMAAVGSKKHPSETVGFTLKFLLEFPKHGSAFWIRHCENNCPVIG